MISLTPAQKKDPAIVHALKVRVAVAKHDYHIFTILPLVPLFAASLVVKKKTIVKRIVYLLVFHLEWLLYVLLKSTICRQKINN